MTIAEKLSAIAEAISARISAANGKTGKSDTTLTEAVQSLCDGYGQGGGGSGLSFSSSANGTMPEIPKGYANTEINFSGMFSSSAKEYTEE